MSREVSSRRWRRGFAEPSLSIEACFFAYLGVRKLHGLQECGQPSPPIVAPSYNLILPATVVPADDNPPRRALVKPEIQGTESA